VQNLTILNGNITAIGLYTSGIGSGFGNTASDLSSVENLTIYNGFINATGSYGAGIGSGCSFVGTSAITRLVILNGIITTTSDWFGAGIGSGYSYNKSANSSVSRLSILGGNIISVWFR
jgi:hypothetical protein